jgi:hypothetical protein
MRTRIPNSTAALLMAFAIVIAACGDDAATTSTEATEPTITSTTSTTVPASTTTSTTVPASTTTSTVVVTASDLESLPLIEDQYGVTSSGDGWLVPAGVYTTERFAQSIRIELTDPVGGLGVDLLAFARPDFSFSADFAVFVSHFLGYADPLVNDIHAHDTSAWEPFEGPEATTDFLDTEFELLGFGVEDVAGTEAHWWEFTVADEGVDGFPCQFGPECFNVLVHEGLGNFIAGADWTYRLWQLTEGEDSLFIWLQATDEDYASGLAFAEGLFEGLLLVPDDEADTAATDALTDEEVAAAEAFAEAYNTNDFEAMGALFPGGTPEISLTVGRQAGTWTADEMEREMQFAATIGDRWELEGCKKQYGRVTCRFSVVDPLIEALFDQPLTVSLFFSLENGKLVDPAADLVDAFLEYDGPMHRFGEWFEDTYPDQGTMQGFHHRGWNIEDSGAAELFVQYLDEWLDSREG